MDNWNRLLTLLDITLGFPNKIRSSVKKKWQAFDQRTGEHVFMLEYRTKVKPGITPPPKQIANPRDVHARAPVKPGVPAKTVGPMGTLRELMDVRFVNTVDSSPSLPSAKKDKKTTRKSTLGRKKTRPNPSVSPIKPV